MAYRIEVGQDPSESLYLEFVFINRNNGAPIQGDGVDHQLWVYGWGEDYGLWGEYGQLVASNANGLIVTPAPGTIAINVPPNRLPGCCWMEGGPSLDRAQTLRCKLLAVPTDPVFTKLLAKIDLSFGGRMGCPRITLETFPLYPNSPTASVVPDVDVAQLKRALLNLGGTVFDTVEAGLGGPTDAATMSWNSGGPVSLGGPLADRISLILQYGPNAMLQLFAAASDIKL